MVQFHKYLLLLCWLLPLIGCSKADKGSPLFDAGSLEAQLQQYVADKDARIGIAVISDAGDTVTVNGSDSFPMLSVYKFPQALAVANFMDEQALSLQDTIRIDASQMHPDTYSPMRDRYGMKDLKLPLSEVLGFSMQQSDNNACDILFDLIGGPVYADKFISDAGFPEIHIRSTEDDMHRDNGLCYHNSTTPLEMARLIAFFDTRLSRATENYMYIAGLMENCETGTDRLGAAFDLESITLGHKTGTGDINSDGRITGVNDVGYVRLPDGRSYYIAVLVSDSSYDLPQTASFIARISEIVFNAIN